MSCKDDLELSKWRFYFSVGGSVEGKKSIKIRAESKRFSPKLSSPLSTLQTCLGSAQIHASSFWNNITNEDSSRQ